ncbi:uncharacterized protein N7446_010541 [Penicillium canescens]|uniref:uncharacterized protein n=1 Tax=Penicillium canescens TaxID=5083 RepID=UPI0026DEA1C5|nr:uncharacterized protein N7446_010541 [Penicillium canescens]KAJ6050432.1 hypothetical protein N7446_010541 [Penicillium canescens]KAJ6064735.1 hypothetical protein N7444_000388 [Penicillium canescens]
MTNTSPDGAWVFEKAILVYTPDFDITADVEHIPRSSQRVYISPEKQRPPLSAWFVFHAPGACQKVSAVSTLSLTLSETGIVLCPTGMETLSPANPGDLNFDAFAKICYSTSLCLYISQRQFADEELDQLEIFSGALRSLQAKTFQNARHGVEERGCGVFARWLNPNPPPYPEERVSEQGDPPVYCRHSEQVTGKRRTVPWLLSPDDKARKRLLLTSPERLSSTSPEALDSPTEPTPSTRSSSPSSIRSIPPTDFMLASSPGRTKRKRLARLEEELRGVSDEEICQVLIRSGRQYLLAIQKDVDRDLSSESETVGIANVNMLERRLKHSLKQYVDETIEHLKSQVVGDIVESALNECDEAIEGRYRTHEADLEEQVDDYKVDLGITANDCTKEIEEQALRCMDDIEDQGIKVEKSATERFAELTRCLSDSAQSLLDSKSSPGQRRTEGPEARRISI